MATETRKRWFARQLLTLGPKEKYTRLKPGSSIILRAVRTKFMIHNSPSFSGLRIKIYSDRGGVPLKLIATSTNSFNAADVYSLAYSPFRGVYFEFSDIPLDGDTYYHFVPEADSYTGTDSSFIAWNIQYPKEVNSGFTVMNTKVGVIPPEINLIGRYL